MPNISIEALNAVVETLSKKTVEDMLATYGRRVSCRGSETWMTESKYHTHVRQNWDSILQMAKGTAEMRGHRAPEPEEEDDPTNATATSSANGPICLKLAIDTSFATFAPLEFVVGLREKFPIDVPVREATHEIFTVANLIDYVAKYGLATSEFDITQILHPLLMNFPLEMALRDCPCALMGRCF